jgi:hypothetical protein
LNSWGSYRQRLVVVIRVLLAGGGAVRKQAWAGGDGDAGWCRRGGGVLASGSIWVLVEQVAGLLRFL